MIEIDGNYLLYTTREKVLPGDNCNSRLKNPACPITLIFEKMKKNFNFSVIFIFNDFDKLFEIGFVNGG